MHDELCQVLWHMHKHMETDTVCFGLIAGFRPQTMEQQPQQTQRRALGPCQWSK
jgi:hypothetical protein